MTVLSRGSGDGGTGSGTLFLGEWLEDPLGPWRHISSQPLVTQKRAGPADLVVPVMGYTVSSTPKLTC